MSDSARAARASTGSFKASSKWEAPALTGSGIEYPPHLIEVPAQQARSGGPCRDRTCGPLIKSRIENPPNSTPTA